MIPNKLAKCAFSLAVLWMAGCAETHETHLVGAVSYFGLDSEDEFEVPDDADPQVAKCAGQSTLQTTSGRGIKNSQSITPPYFVALWPAPPQNQPEVHGRIDRISTGKPLPGDHPFIKFSVCTLGTGDNFDWKLKEQLNGQYYVGAWFDKDMNGYPGVHEALGFYHGEGTEPVLVSFPDAKAVHVSITIGNSSADFEDQVNAVLANVEVALKTKNSDLFASQFQPLYYRDAFSRTINQIDLLYAELVSNTNAATNKIAWVGGTSAKKAGTTSAKGTITLTQSKNPDVWDLNQNLVNVAVVHTVELSFGAGADGIWQIMDWHPLSIDSADMTQAATVKSNVDANSDVDIKLDNVAEGLLWMGIESFVPDVVTGSYGKWVTTVGTTVVGTNAVLNMPTAGSWTFAISPNNLNGNPGLLVGLPVTTVTRVTFFPIAVTGGYTAWPGYPSVATEPTRGNFMRFYFYGADYVYRKVIPK